MIWDLGSVHIAFPLLGLIIGLQWQDAGCRFVWIQVFSVSLCLMSHRLFFHIRFCFSLTLCIGCKESIWSILFRLAEDLEKVFDLDCSVDNTCFFYPSDSFIKVQTRCFILFVTGIFGAGKDRIGSACILFCLVEMTKLDFSGENFILHSFLHFVINPR